MFAGGLSGAPCSRPGAPNLSANAVVFVAIDPEHFAGAEHFLTEVTDLAAAVRTCPKAEGAGEILLPGDPERLTAERRTRGGVELDAGTWGQVSKLAAALKVELPAAR
jgi:uncharacterized oxidoreductase